MQHNNFKKDLAMLTEAYNDIHDQAKVRPEEAIPPQHQDENIGIGEDGEGNVYERPPNIEGLVTVWLTKSKQLANKAEKQWDGDPQHATELEAKSKTYKECADLLSQYI